MDETVRVGSFSNLDRILPSRTVKKSDATLPLEKATEGPSLNYKFQGNTFTIDDYLSHQRATGLLVIKDGRILVERYQYERTKDQRLLSNSMAKSIVSMGIAIALRDGSIRSLDDTAAELLRPMLRHWLDENMPRIVEKALRIELAQPVPVGKSDDTA